MKNIDNSIWSRVLVILAVLVTASACRGFTPATEAPASTYTEPTLSSTDQPSPEPTTQPIFSQETSIKVPPEDIIQQVGFIGGYGGGPSCKSDSYPGPTIDESFLWYENDSTELMQLIELGVCGLNSTETVEATVYLPDGSTEVYSGTSEPWSDKDYGFFDFRYIPSLEQPTGSYRFVFEGSQGTAEYTINVVDPDGPRFYVDTKEPFLILYNFAPHEKVRVFVYGADNSELSLTAWEEFNVNESGALTIKNEYIEPSGYDDSLKPMGEFVAVGEKSGQVGYLFKGWGEAYSSWVSGDVICTDAPPPVPGLGPNKYAEVINDKAFVVSFSDSRSVNLPLGTKIRIFQMSGPYCDNGSFWWLVMCNDISYQGLGCSSEYEQFKIPEGASGEQYLRAVP